ncbi:cysteine desulfurase family protein [Alkalihalobacillus trypoxylicola]|uniref:cysteine desulfurase n=1 Tax=Alkalihalobacillus trypoxylicola TaxID=519424 RepID=A0A161Q6D9_9BACI|nr:cysteine desulfurase family protein [Alkalihalobacillus trypoxylicola]KYG31888.1 cysteine desulfurase NifS [Alkalihalobacillus trypoxylicola]
METIYLDHAATSPIHPEVVKVMMEVYEDNYGNPSSIHQTGRKARSSLDKARKLIAQYLCVSESELIFTSGGTESDNLAIIGYALANQKKGKHIITSSIEHHATLHACQELERKGFTVTYLPVDETGRVSLSDLKEALTAETILVTIMYGNNEVGTLQPINEISELLKDHQAKFHTDAVQACGVIPLFLNELAIDLVSISAHKLNGPKGVGLLYIKEGTVIQPGTFGGEQERKRRAGTENVAGVVGFAKAFEIAQKNMEIKNEQFKSFSRAFFDILERSGIDFLYNGNQNHQLPHIFNVSFPHVSVEAMLVNLDMEGISASSGSACTAGSIEPSHVLVAMFPDHKERYESAIRFSFGLNNTLKQVEEAAHKTVKVVKRLQKSQPFIV